MKKHAERIFAALVKNYPDADIALSFANPFELVIATILSAQCTDARVNSVTPALFAKYKTPEDFAAAAAEELEKDIFSTGFYKQKAKSIKACCAALIEKHEGKIPQDFDALVKLPGIGRKTASVVVYNGFGIPAVAVDTHVKRLSNLLGFIDSEDPEKIEARLKELLPQNDWGRASHLLATHGRTVCFARKPNCKDCVLQEWCPAAHSPEVKKKKN